ncbi:MAG: outer membrane beta-barrel protein [Gemmatimonadota bacterium]
MRTLSLVVVALALVVPSAQAQSLRGVGVQVGHVESKQIVTNGDDSGTRSGLMGGLFIDVQTPAPLLSVLAEASFVQRGGTFTTADPSTGGDVEADYLTFTVAPELHVDIGPAGAFAYAGPTAEASVRTRYAPALAAAYQNPASLALAATAGGGVELRLLQGWAFRLEARVVEGLSAAFTGDAGEFKHRSSEFLVRVGRRGGP